MWVQNLHLQNFRNYHDASIFLNPGLNVIHGENGQGKTTVLEALEYAASGRSPRAHLQQELIQWNANHAAVHCNLVAKDEIRIDILLNRSGKRTVKVDNLLREELAQWIGTLRAVSFFPNDLQLISGEPTLRRRFLNIEISKTNPAYVFDYMQYKRCLQQRNALLKEHVRRVLAPGQLEIWDAPLSECGARILLKRLRFLHRLSETIGDIHSSLSGQRERLRLRYVSNVFDREAELPDDKTDVEVSEDDVLIRMREELQRRRGEERQRGATLVGPHRDDVLFLLNLQGSPDNWIDLRRFGSQGQQRTAALATKLATARCMLDETSDSPSVLLDDVLSELDAARREAVLRQLSDFDQFIITTTDPDLIKPSTQWPTSFYETQNGAIQPVA